MELALSIVWLVSVGVWGGCAATRRISLSKLFHLATPAFGALLGVLLVCNLFTAVTVVVGAGDLLKWYQARNVSFAVGVPLLAYLWVRFVVLATHRVRSTDS